jgi:hypothetical protein
MALQKVQSQTFNVTGDLRKVIRKFDSRYQSPDKRGVSPTLKIKRIDKRTYKVYFS